jgi:dihydroneopterin aldolase
MSAADIKFEPLPASVVRLEPAGSVHETMDVIFIEGLEAITVIGICENELHDPQPVRIDISAGVPRVMACATDKIVDTIDYSEVRSAVLNLLDTHRLQLLEALAEEIAQLLLGRFGAHWTRVVVVKPNKFADLKSVGVVIERRRVPVQRGAGGDGSVLSLLGAGMVPDRP